jgi:hypothetical protein
MAVRNRILSISLVSLLFLTPSVLWSQATGEILGTVQDPSGAVVPNAKITAVEAGTSLTRSAVSGTSGTYFLPDLVVGTYSVSVAATGFKTVVSKGITLNVNQQREVNFTLAVAASSQHVEVHASVPLANVTNGTLGGLVSGQQVATLPLNGRDIGNLILMQPGVNYEVQGGSGAFPGHEFVAANGNRGTTDTSYLDGIDTSDEEYGGGNFSNFNLDAIAEFKVLQNNFSAQYGHGSGAIVQIATMSGTNELHGSAFEFVRNSAFDARNFFSSTVPPFRRNEFGATFGGPVVLPKVYSGKNRTFFFVEYAGERQRLGEPIFLAVPTPAERNGVVSITGANGQPDQLKIPVTPAAASILNKYPLPNDPTGPDGARTFTDDYSLPYNVNQYSIRIDHKLSDKDSLFGRFTNDRILEPWVDAQDLEGPDFSAQEGNYMKNLGLSYTHVFSPALLNTLLFGYIRSEQFTGYATQAFTTSMFSDGSLSTWGPDGYLGIPIPKTWQLKDTLNWVKGRDSFDIGFGYLRLRHTEAGGAEYGPAGTYYFEPGQPIPVAVPSVSGLNNLAPGSPSPSSLVSFMLGIPTFYGRTLAFPGFGPEGGGETFGIRRNSYNAWIQDDIKASRNLTLNLGLRYEYNGVPSEVDNRFLGIDTSPGTLFGKVVLNPSPAWSPDYTGFGPRVGFAYRLTQKTTVRGGWGIFTNLPMVQTAEQNGSSFPFYSTAVATNPTYSISPQPVSLPYVTDLQGNVMPPSGNSKLIKPNTPVNLVPLESIFGSAGLEAYLPDPNLKNGYTMDGNFTLERQLAGDSLLQVSYVSNNAVRLYNSIYPNGWTGSPSQYTPYTNSDPGLGELSLTSNGGHSSYNALQAMVRKISAQHGLTFQASYTWSKALDNASTVFNGAAANSAALPQSFLCYACEKGPADFDFPQRFVMNFMYQLPFRQWQALSFMPSRLTQGWEIESIISAQSGYPFTVNDSFPIKGLGEDTIYCGPCVTRPDLVQTPTMSVSAGPDFFSPAVIADGANLTQKYFATPGALATGLQSAPGSLGRNTFRTQPFSNWDFSLIKDTNLGERATLQFRAEFFNILNQHAFLLPGAVLGSPSFGVASSTALSEREIQFALRLTF